MRCVLIYEPLTGPINVRGVADFVVSGFLRRWVPGNIEPAPAIEGVRVALETLSIRVGIAPSHLEVTRETKHLGCGLTEPSYVVALSRRLSGEQETRSGGVEATPVRTFGLLV